eukprot:Em0006g545a
MMTSTYSFPEYIDQQKVSIVINNIKDGLLYYFSIYASNVYGTSAAQFAVRFSNSTVAPATTPATIVSATEKQASSIAGPVTGGVIGGIVFVLVILIIVVFNYFVLRHRGGTYEMANTNKGVKVEEIDVEFGEDTQPTTKQEIHYAELGSFKPKEPTQPKLTVAQKAAEEEPVTYSTVQINSATTPKEPTQGASDATKTDASTTMISAIPSTGPDLPLDSAECQVTMQPRADKVGMWLKGTPTYGTFLPTLVVGHIFLDGTGKPAVFDVTVTSSLTPVSLNNTSASLEAAANAAECRKHATNDTSQAIPKHKMLAEIYGHLNMSLVRSVARAIMGRELFKGVHPSIAAWKQAQLSLSRGGLGLRSLSHHAPAAFIASLCFSGLGSISHVHLLQSLEIFNSSVHQSDNIQIGSVLEKLPSQKTLSSILDDNLFRVLQGSLSIADRARLLSASSPHASSWLTVTPSEGQGLHLDPPVFQTALKWWLGLDTAEGSICALCPDKMLDPLGHHATTCKRGGDVVFRHNKLRDILAETCRRAHLSVQVEAGCNLTPDHSHSRPADVLISNWVLGKTAACDISVTSPLNSNIMSEAGVTAGAAAQATELRKHEANDVKCSELGWLCIPLVVESYGAWGKEAMESFSSLASRLAITSSRPKSAVLSELYGRLNLNLVRANDGGWRVTTEVCTTHKSCRSSENCCRMMVPNGAEIVNPYSNPASGSVLSYDLNQPGPTMTCIGSSNSSGTPTQQNTQWKVLYSTGQTQTIVSSSIFYLSMEPLPVGGFGQTNLTILNVTNILDGATISCGITVSAQLLQIASFTVKIYRAPMLKTVGTVNGLKDGSVTFQIGDTLSPPPYPPPTFTAIAGNGTLTLNQIEYNHPNLTLSGLTEFNSGSYMLTAENFRFNGIFLGASNGTFALNVQFAPVITAGGSQVAAVQGQPYPVSLQCGKNLRGNPFPTVQWKSSNGTVVTSGGRYAMDNGPSNVQLNISNVDRSSNGTWMCILSNRILSSVVVNISLFVLVPPSPPPNVTDGQLPLTNPKSQVSVSWKVPTSRGVPLLSVYRVAAVSARDPMNHTTSWRANQTFATIDMLKAGLNYTIMVYAVSIIGTTEAVSSPSDMVILSTAPDVPTVMCSSPAAILGNVNVSWTISYDGGRPVTTIQIGYRQVGIGGNEYQDTQAVVSPGATSAIIMQQFVATSSYAFQVNVTNEVGTSTSLCGQVTISEGIPLTPKIYTPFTYGKNSVAVMLSTDASGAGTTDSFAFRLVTDTTYPYQNDQLVNQSFPFRSYISGAKVVITVLGLQDGVTYFFLVYAINVYGVSNPISITVLPKVWCTLVTVYSFLMPSAPH